MGRITFVVLPTCFIRKIISNLTHNRMQTITTFIKGYYPLCKCESFPECSGIYFVYTGYYSPLKNKLTLYKLIYIGESENIRERICNHEKLNEWKSHLENSYSTLWFAFCKLDKDTRVIAESAYINHHKPVVNVEYKNSFPYDRKEGGICLLPIQSLYQF